MVRTKVKGTKFKAASSPDNEPDFYKMLPVVVTPQHSDCDHSENEDCSSGHDSSSKGTSEAVAFQPPHHPFEKASRREYAPRPQETPKSPMVTRLAMQIFGSDPLDEPFSPQASAQVSYGSPVLANYPRDYVATRVIAAAPSISSAPSNEYMDLAIDELFLDDAQATNDVMDFVNAWDQEFEMGPVTNDLELGNLLDKILED